MSDHKADSEEWLVAAERPDVPAGEFSTSLAAIAQVHATLALVEQQRIANLIAFSDHSFERWGNYAGEAGGMGVLFSNPESENGNMRVRDDIARALGIRNVR